MISILMPLYNGMEFLDDSINSIIAQTYGKWELLVGINGHTTEETQPIIKKLKSFKDERIKVMVNPTRGKVKTLNKLVHCASFRCICLLDVDDKWAPTKLERQMQLINKYDVVGTDAEYFGDSGGDPRIFLGKLSPLMFSLQNPIINSAVMMKKKHAKWDEKWEGLDDYNMWIDLLEKKRTFYNIPEVLTYHRLHEKSYFNNKNAEINAKLKNEKLKKITEDEMAQLTDIMDNKKWEV
jgi:glycosyltransferase involved in cell wall biosynthesis